MSLQRNVATSYASQIYVTAIGILMVPLYVRYMGAEAYGLVGFFAMMQTWLQLLDMGMTPTLSRETARLRGGGTDAATVRALLRALEALFLAGGLAAAFVLAGAADVIATRWLRPQALPPEEIRHALQLMGLAVALRWVSGLYRGAITGFEQLVWLGSFNALVATARFVLVLPLLAFVGNAPSLFFAFQCVVAALELAVLVAKTYRLLPGMWARGDRLPRLALLRSVFRFSAAVAFSSIAWVVVTQTDKVLLSRLLPLADFGIYTLAVLVASGVLLVSGPVGAALMPRLTRLHAQGDAQGVLDLYRLLAQITAALATPAALLLAAVPELVIATWTGDAALAVRAAPVLRLYAAGNGLLALASCAYYLQFARGDLRLHLWGSLLLVALIVPAIAFSAWHWGATGAGWAWLAVNLVYFAGWLPLVHQRCGGRTLHTGWLYSIAGVAGAATITVGCGVGIVSQLGWPASRVESGLGLFLVGSLAVAVALLAIRPIRTAAALRLFHPAPR